MLAYSSAGQMGLILFALGVGTIEGIAGGLFQLITHVLSKSLLFLATGYMIYRTGSMEINSLQGIGRKMPLSCLAFTIGAFSLIGLPPFIGFPSKLMIVFSALLKQNVLYTVFIVIVLIGTVIEGAYFFKVIQALYFKGLPAQKGINAKIQEAPLAALIPMVILMALIIVIGVYPKIMTNILNSAASEFLDRVAYIKLVLK
jgi:formate hydrogenlyase subunit 3/multisubunit Na+/H+ antiporter MnhD subunit